MLTETPVTQRSPCFSAVSYSLTNHFYQIVLIIRHFATPHSPEQYFTSLTCQTPYQAAPLETNTSLLQCFTAESSRELMSSEEYCSALRKLNNKQRQVLMFLLLLFKLSSQFPFVYSLFSLSLSSLCSFSQSSLSKYSILKYFFHYSVPIKRKVGM